MDHPAVVVSPRRPIMVSRVFAWGTVFVCWTLTLLSIAFDVLYTQTFRRPSDIQHPAEVVVALSFPLVGALILGRHPRHAVGWLCLALGFATMLSVFTVTYARFTLTTRPGVLPWGAQIGWLGSWVWTLGWTLLAIFLLLYPTGQLLSHRWRLIVWLAIGAALIDALSTALFTWQLQGRPLHEALQNLQLQQQVVGYSLYLRISLVAFLLMVVGMIAGAVSLLWRFRTARGIERLQLQWLTYAAAIFTGALLLGALIDPVFGQTMLFRPSTWLEGACSLGIPVAIGVAMLRYHVFDIELLINRTLVYGLLTLGVVATYIGTVGYLGAIFHASGNLAISLLATGLIAVLFHPLRDWVQIRVNRLLYGQRDEPYVALAHLGQRLEGALTPDVVLPTIVETVAHSLKLPYVAIAVGTESDLHTAASYGEPLTETLTFPLIANGEIAGRLVIAPRGPGERFSPADQRLLRALARQAGSAVQATQLMFALQHARERLVMTREEERRRLRRDLHDGLGPVLGALTLKLDAARNLLHSDRDRTEAILLDLKQQVQTIITDVRHLVYALRPPALDELGLAGAVEEQARTVAHNTALRVIVDIPSTLPLLPAAVEVAIYHIAREALTNVVRHAQATECVIAVKIVSDAVILTICDDGIGLPATIQPGVGLLAMRERAEELGGTCAIAAPTNQGTTVTVHLPLTPDRIPSWTRLASLYGGIPDGTV